MVIQKSKICSFNSRDVLLKADRIECNLTGGTTALQYAVIQLADLATKLGKDVSWIALADERSKKNRKLSLMHLENGED